MSVATATPTRFTFLIDGEPTFGTIEDYAHAVEQAHYSGVDISESVVLVHPQAGFSFDIATHVIRVIRRKDEATIADWMTGTVSIETGVDKVEVATYRIDGRA